MPKVPKSENKKTDSQRSLQKQTSQNVDISSSEIDSTVVQQASQDPSMLSQRDVLRLQRSVGNQRVGQMISRDSSVGGGGSTIQRSIGEGKDNSLVQHTETQKKYVAHLAGENYKLQPVDKEVDPLENIAASDEEYDVVKDYGAASLEGLEGEDLTTHLHETAEWHFAAAQAAIDRGDPSAAIAMLQRAHEKLTQTKESGDVDQEPLSDGVLKSMPYGNFIFRVLKSNALMPESVLEQTVETKISQMRGVLEKRAALPKASEQKSAEQINKEEAARVVSDFVTERRKPKYIDALLGIVTDKKGEALAAEKESYLKEVPSLMEDMSFKSAYVKMAGEKFGHENKNKETPYDEVLITKVNEETGELKDKIRQKYHILYHLGIEVAEQNLKQSLDEILKEGMHNKTARMKYLFKGRGDLVDEVTKNIKEEALHISFTQMLESNDPHSIKDINDYVGDKLNDPLMDWIISEGIPVEIHGTSLLGSFGRLKSEGFTDIIEIPSSHTGTKKFVVSNPKTEMAKVVFQTLPGKSYTVQASGPFLFYELYTVGGEVERELSQDETATFVHEGYKARNLISSSEGVAQYLLVNEEDQEYLVAEVPFVEGSPHKINSAGEIELASGVKENAVTLKEVDVRRLPKEQLKVFSEDVDHAAMYQDALSSLGIDGADIAAIGRKRELKKLLETTYDVTPVQEATLPYFNVSVFKLKSGERHKTLLAFQISPDFFGDKAGYLAEALDAIGVKHITFVGTAGGLGEGLAKGDVVVPETMQNYADLEQGEEKTNSAFGMLGEFESEGIDMEGVKGGGLHLGVHSPITESESMIKKMKGLSVGSVDCEGGFIANALAESDVSVYNIFYISDVPGSQESIGEGGIAKSEGLEEVSEETNVTEKMVVQIIKKVVEQEIEQADVEVQQNVYSLAKDGRLNKTIKIDGKKKGVTVGVVIPGGFEGDVIGIFKVFEKRLSDFLDSKGGNLEAVDTGEIDEMVAEIYQTYRIQLIVNYEER